MVRNRTKNPLSCWINTFPHRNKSYIWHNTLFTHCFADKRAMVLKKQQHQQQQQQERQQRHNTPSPPLPNGSPPSSPGTSSFIEDRPWGESSSTAIPSNVIDTAMNDRFIHEAGPPTAISILRTQPAFIGKLYKMLEDTTQDMICWSANGDYFSVYNSSLFSKQVLPQYFKHNNWQSFVRQLNMYGFSKINEMIHSNLNYDNQAWDFKHPHFKRGDFQSLVLVKRKSVRPSGMSSVTSSSSSPYQPNMLASHNGGSDSGMDTGSSDILTRSSSTQTTNDFSTNTETEVDHRVRLLDEKVRHVSSNVNNLTSEILDIKSLIYKQQNIIHELVTLVRNYTDSSPSTELSSSSAAIDNVSHRNNSLPSIHNLAGDLQANPSSHSNSENSHHYHHHRPHPLYHHSSLLRQLPREASRSPPLADQEQQRRSSHPSSLKGKSVQNSNPIYPLLNSETTEDNL